MFNGGTRKRMLAAAIGNSHQRVNTENSHPHHNNRTKYHDPPPMQQETNTPPCPSLPHNAVAAAAAAAVAGRATLAAARAACAAASVVQASATSTGKEGTAEKGYGELYEVSNHSQRNKVSIFKRNRTTCQKICYVHFLLIHTTIFKLYVRF